MSKQTTTQVSKAIGLQRLEKMCDFLETKVPTKSFEFGEVCRIGERAPLDAIKAGGGCGTVGCVIGWTPAVFPRLVKWTSTEPLAPDQGTYAANVVLKDGSETGYYPAVGAVLFGMDEETADRLFSPNYAQNWGKGRRFAPDDHATPKQVAKHLRAYIKWAREQDD